MVLNEREAKIEAIRNEMEILIDKLSEHYQKALNGSKPDTQWIADYPEKFLLAIEQAEIDYHVKEFAV